LTKILKKNDKDIKIAQANYKKNYFSIRNNLFACTDNIAKILKTQSDLENIKKGKNESSSSEKQLKEVKNNVAQLTQDITNLKRRLESFNKNIQSGLSFDPFQKEQLETYKNMVRCTVCRDNDKDSVLNTCFHVFCKSCLESNLQSRHRKCPGCNIPFDRQNIKSINFLGSG